MGYLLQQMVEAAQATGATYRVLPDEETLRIRDRVAQTFCDPNFRVGGSMFWQSVSVHGPSVWKWPAEFTGDDPVIVFFDLNEDETAIEFATGKQFQTALYETYGFAFFTTDRDCSYVMLFVYDHDGLTGAGRAANFIRRKRQLSGTARRHVHRQPKKRRRQ